MAQKCLVEIDVLLLVAIFCKEAVQEWIGVLIRSRLDDKSQDIRVIFRDSDAGVVELLVKVIVEYHELGGVALLRGSSSSSSSSSVGVGLKMVDLTACT